MPDTITITLSLPHKALSPNASSCRSVGAIRRKARVARDYRGESHLKAMEAQGSARPLRWPAATVTATFFHKVRRARDEDNAIASLKAAIDGVADSGLIVNDVGLRWERPRFEIDKAWPRVELVFVKQETQR